MKITVAFLAVFLFLGAEESFAQSCSVVPGGNPAVLFVDSGLDTAIQSGSLGLVCTIDWTPKITGDGAGAGYDFSGFMNKGGDRIPFTGTWDLKPSGVGGIPFVWTFTATATGLLAAPRGLYFTNVSFTVEP